MDFFAVRGVLGVAHASGILLDLTLEILAFSVMLGDTETAVEDFEAKSVFGCCYNELHNLSFLIVIIL
tara:strand:+ start:2623 stop:2826 length:204 start_codon:yes stop_codon:yes gene_type:complete